MTATAEAAATTTELRFRARRAVGAEVGRLFEQHGRMVLALCTLLLREREEAEDALQQTFLSAHRSMLAGTVPEEPAAWLAAIARNECLSRIRRRRPAPVPLTERHHPASRDIAEVVDERAEIAALSEALAGLPPAQRQAVILRDFYGLSYREVSAALGISGSAVESLLFKSRKRLQERLRPLHAGSGAAALPLAVRGALARAIPGFSNGLTATGAGAAGAGITTKIASAPAAAKIAALVIAAAGGVAAAGEVAPPAPQHPHVTVAAAPIPVFAGTSPVTPTVAIAHTSPAPVRPPERTSTATEPASTETNESRQAEVIQPAAAPTSTVAITSSHSDPAPTTATGATPATRSDPSASAPSTTVTTTSPSTSPETTPFTPSTTTITNTTTQPTATTTETTVATEATTTATSQGHGGQSGGGGPGPSPNGDATTSTETTDGGDSSGPGHEDDELETSSTTGTISTTTDSRGGDGGHDGGGDGSTTDTTTATDH